MSNHVLFLSEKFIANSPVNGISNIYNNIIETFQYCQPAYKVFTLHYDELFILSRVHVDQILLNYCLQFDIQLVFVSLLSGSQLNPSVNCLKSLKDNGIKLVFIFWDNNESCLKSRAAIKDISFLNVSLDSPRSNQKDFRIESNRDIYLWTPENRHLFYPQHKDIKVSFIGSTRYADRAFYCQKLLELVPDIIIRGGQREESLSINAYAELIRRSKISINFSKNPMNGSYAQLKGRVLESIASKCLLMEESNESTMEFFTPFVDYVEFDNITDLVDKIKYYSENDEERLRISENGYKKFQKLYTAEAFWQKVMNIVNENKNK